jgi:thioredoxin
MGSSTREITAKNFEETIEKGGIVLLDWWAPWCGPCRSFAPVFEKTAAAHPDMVFGKINTDEEQDLAQAFEIRSIPTLMVFRDGILLFAQPGAVPGTVLEQVIAKVQAIDMNEVKKEIEKHEKEHGHKHGPDCDHDH